MSQQSTFRDTAYQIWLCIALLCAIAAPTIGLIASEHADRVAHLKAEGMVTMAMVTDIREVQEGYTDRKGRQKSRTKHFIDLRYNMLASTPYRDFLASGRLAPDKGRVVMVSASRSSSRSESEALRVGQEVAVVVDPDDHLRVELFTFVRDFSSTTSYLIIFGSVLIGLLSGWMAWRRRRVLLAQRTMA